MKRTRLVTACMVLPFLLALCVFTASAAGSGTLAATDALEIKGGEDGHVLIFLNGSYDPAVKGLTLKVDYNESIAECTEIIKSDSAGSGAIPKVRSSGFALALSSGSSIPTGVWLFDITFKAKKNDGSRTEVGLELVDIGVDDNIQYLSDTNVRNGTFTTKDDVAPAIAITTPTSVSSTFTIAGTITEVGGMGSARATLTSATRTESFELSPLGGSAPDYTFSKQVTWPVETDVTLTVTATDAAGNTQTETQTINVVDVGFSLPEPTGYINATPAYARAYMSQIDTAKPITMYLGSATYGPTLLTLDITTGYAKGGLPSGLGDGAYWVNVSGTDKFGKPQSLNWTFTLDTSAPTITAFTIADSDGDGYIEAGETLTLNWDVTADPSFDHVALVDRATKNVLWQNTGATGKATTKIADGNRDLEFRAYDRAGNYDKRGFHLYYDYMIWVNSTKAGVVSGIDTTYTAAKDLSRTSVSSVTLYNGCTVPLPTLETLKRTVTNLGQVTPDTYVVADNTANRTLAGSETYQTTRVYNPNKVFDFSVKVPHAPRAILVLAEANESYIADLNTAGKGGINSIEFADLIQKTAYIFINGGWTKVAVDADGNVTMPASSGNAITVGSGIDATLRNSANQVNLDTGYRLKDQGLDPITLAPGDYALAAIAMDGDRIGLLAAMPVLVHESPDEGSISAKSVVKNGTFTAGFTTPCERLGVLLLRDTPYKGTAVIDAATLGKDTLRLDITHNGIPATQKLIGNVYVSPNSGAYVVANTNKATVQTTGLDVGTYRVYLVGQSARGTMQAYGVYTLEITPAVTPTPTPTQRPNDNGHSHSSSGSSVDTPLSYSKTATLQTSSSGTVLRSIMVNAGDNVGSILVPSGVKALDANGKSLSEVSIKPVASDKMPAVPSGALFQFAGYVYEASPDGATFEPGITLTFDIPEDAWNALDLNGQQLVVKWYNKKTGLWEDVLTTVSKNARSVSAKITHFSTYALFTEPATTTTPTEAVTPVTPTTSTTSPVEEPSAEGLPMTMILIVIAVVVIAAAGYFFVTKK